MCLRVQRVTGMPCNVDIWVDDGVDCFTIYIDKRLITERGASALQRILRTTASGWRRVDEALVMRTLRAVTG
jgi:hypothetical protein